MYLLPLVGGTNAVVSSDFVDVYKPAFSKAAVRALMDRIKANPFVAQAATETHWRQLHYLTSLSVQELHSLK